MVTGGMLTQVRNGVAEALSLVTPIIVRSKIFRLFKLALLLEKYAYLCTGRSLVFVKFTMTMFSRSTRLTEDVILKSNQLCNSQWVCDRTLLVNAEVIGGPICWIKCKVEIRFR